MINFLSDAFHIILYRPLFNILVLFYKYLPGHDFGVAVIFLTVLIKILLYPLNNKAIRAQKDLSILQPKLEEIKKKYKNDKEKMVSETINLYKKTKINPFSSILPLLVQLPIMIALFRVFQLGFSQEQMGNLYPLLSEPEIIDTTFLNIIDLEKTSPALAFINGIFQFIQTKMFSLKTDHTQGEKTEILKRIQKQTVYFSPIFTVLILWNFPAVIGIYWLITVLFAIVQQYLIFYRNNNQQKIWSRI